jgi:hypothetical protein
LSSYCSGLIDAGLSNIPKTLPVGVEYPPYHGSLEEHLRLLRISNDVIDKLIKHHSLQEAATPTLLHADLNKRNIFVSADDPTVVTGVIDWQWTSVEPAFVHMREPPDFASLAGLPKDWKPPSEGEVVTQRDKAAQDLIFCGQAFDRTCRNDIPKLYSAKWLGEDLVRLLHYCDGSWKFDVAAIRQELIKVSTRWTELGLPGSCPYVPTEDELTEHKKQYDDCELADMIRIRLREVLGCTHDGWVPAEMWDWARTWNRHLFEKWIKNSTNIVPGRDEVIPVEKARRLWPFDER